MNLIKIILQAGREFLQAGSKDNVFNYAVIKNAYQAVGVQDPSPNANPKLVLNECIIDNAFDAGIISLNSSVRARNCLISNCGKNVFLAKGGDYQFTHCTLVTYANRFIDHREPVLVVSNFISVNNNPVTANLNAVFRNCIFWGENGLVDNEVLVAKVVLLLLMSTLITVYGRCRLLLPILPAHK